MTNRPVLKPSAKKSANFGYVWTRPMMKKIGGVERGTPFFRQPYQNLKFE